MSMPTEAVEALHVTTLALKSEHLKRDEVLKVFGGSGAVEPIYLTEQEAEQIFAQRIAAHESRLKELGWTRAVRVESVPVGV